MSCLDPAFSKRWRILRHVHVRVGHLALVAHVHRSRVMCNTHWALLEIITLRPIGAVHLALLEITTLRSIWKALASLHVVGASWCKVLVQQVVLHGGLHREILRW